MSDIHSCNQGVIDKLQAELSALKAKEESMRVENLRIREALVKISELYCLEEAHPYDSLCIPQIAKEALKDNGRNE